VIEGWVRDGGWLYGSCGAGSRNQFDEPSPGLAKSFGIEPAIQSDVQAGRYHIRGALNELSYTDEIALQVTPELGEPATFGVLGVRIRFKPTTGSVIGKFKNGNPSVVVNDFGKGKAIYFGTCPGLSYLKDARFVPKELKEQYPTTQRRIIDAIAAARGVARLIELSHPSVEAGIYDSSNGSALVLANFTYQSIDKLAVRVPLARRIHTVRSLDGGKLSFQSEKASPALQSQGYVHVAAFITRLGLNDIILLE
jgi:hypothetical protein